MNKLFIVLPAYNEENNIESVVSEWYPHLANASEDSKMIIADGGSSDNTLNILYELQTKYPKLEVIEKPGTDHGTKLWFLYDYAIKHGADYIFQTDSDGQTNADEFIQFWNLRDEYDALLGVRSDRKDGVQRVFVEQVLRLFLRVFFQAKTPDANAPFRLMKTSLVSKYLYKLPNNFNLPNALLSAYFSHFDENVRYLYVSFKPRCGGKNYMNLKRIIKIGWQSIGNFYRLRKDF